MKLDDDQRAILQLLARKRGEGPGGVLVWVQHLPEGKRLLNSLCRRRLVGRFGRRDPAWGQEYKITPRGRAAL